MNRSIKPFYVNLPVPPAIVSETVHFEIRKALDANAPDEKWKVTTTLRADGKTRVSAELVR
jgi:hypothetical protein